jgi:type I restriction enzyme S subunit
MKEIEKEDGEIRIFAGGKTVINAHEADIPNANITTVPAVLVQSRGVIDAVFYEKPFTFKNEMWAYTHENTITVKYLYYVLKNDIEHFREAASGMGSLPQISLPVTEEYIFMLPSPDKQKEIVEMLDRFDTLCNDITEGLPAEIEARQKQYEYYRDKLLSFKEN